MKKGTSKKSGDISNDRQVNKRAGKCTEKLTAKICILIEQGMSWTRIAEVLGEEASYRSMMNWKNEASEFYDETFTAAVKAAQEKHNLGEMKSDQIRQSRFHTLKKVIRERMVIDVRTKKAKVKLPPPKMPPQSFRKPQIVDYAYDILDLELDEKFTKDEMLVECHKRIIELTDEIMVKVKEEEQECPPNPQAVKNVGTNCGPPAERWNFKQELVHEAEPKTVADIFAAMGIGSDK